MTDLPAARSHGCCHSDAMTGRDSFVDLFDQLIRINVYA
jgi:hypothetical protein